MRNGCFSLLVRKWHAHLCKRFQKWSTVWVHFVNLLRVGFFTEELRCFGRGVAVVTACTLQQRCAACRCGSGGLSVVSALIYR